ncbi:hypothetical protein pEaSNUABM37_00329 [Erwinia phage pEa_SNUABM_37]|nr:hypothetical protein pEaSNUABM37_00329 [Erwinia phage pEa_SNUABM_37]QXO10797.1 hypothetical protein pEaSNUABM48_00329 [Erwinia phage pEa_SNUABM_48]
MSDLSTMTTVDKIMAIRYDPSLMVDFALDLLDKAQAGEIDIPDASNPFFFALEAAALMNTASMQTMADTTAQYYRQQANTQEDLYRHMSDEDYKNRFCTPARLPFMLVMNADEVRQRAVQVAANSNDDIDSVYSKIVYPRNSQYGVAGANFSQEYPLEIRVMKHGGFMVVWDVSQPTPLLNLETNQIDWRVDKINNVEYLTVMFNMRQFTATPYFGVITAMSGYKNTFSLNDEQFYYVRVWTRATVDADWTEAHVTHSDQVFDSSRLTFTAKVLEETVEIRLPEIYVANGLGLGRQVRVDVYTSQGALYLEPTAVDGSNITAQWLDFNYDNRQLDQFSTPITVFNEKTIMTNGTLSGGVNSLSFEALRERVIYAGNLTDLPITPDQITATLSDMGYDALKTEDLVTSRIYQASRMVGKQTNKKLTSSIGTGIITTQMTIEQLVTNSAVFDNGNRVTITPNALFEVVDGVYTMVSDVRMTELRAMKTEDMAVAINNGLYLYSPFYYLLDTNDDAFVTRVYDMDRPKVEYRSFLNENNSIGVEAGVANYSFGKDKDGYVFTLTTTSGDFYKNLDDADVLMQMLFMPENESTYAYLNGKIIGRTESRERVWEFRLTSDMDITEKHELVLNAFGQFGNAPSKLKSLLSGSFTVLNCIAKAKSPNDVVLSDSDKKLGNVYTDRQFVVVTEQQYQLKFGAAMDNIYTRSRPIPSNVAYKKYEEDVFWRYEADEYQYDDRQQLVFDDQGNPIKLHSKGDLRLDAEGQTMIRYHKGDVKFDDQGRPIPISQRVILHEFDMVGLDGTYYFSTNSLDATYVNDVISQLVTWVVDDMAVVKAKLLNQTVVVFRPKQTLGVIDIVANAKEARQISAAVGFSLDVYLTDTGYKNTSLRENLTKAIPTVITELLSRETFSNSDLSDELKPYRTSEVVDIDVAGFGPDHDIKVLTVSDPTLRCAVKKRLDVTSNGGLTVMEDITVNFLKHKDSKSNLSA